MIPAGNLLFVIGVSATWTSFINAVAHRLLYQKSLFEKRSRCPKCDTPIKWYDLVPVLSQLIVLNNKCRACQQQISYLYPFIEAVGTVVFTLLWLKFFTDQAPTLSTLTSFLIHGLYASLLLIALRTDLEEMVILRISSLYAIPLWIELAWHGNILPITLESSLLGATLGYVLPWSIGKLYQRMRDVQGIGEGDLELLGMIGAFTGPIIMLEILLIACVAGLIGSAIYLGFTRQQITTRIPFAPFLVMGALYKLLFR